MVRLKIIKFINRRLFRFACWYDEKFVKHKDPAFCALLDEFYWKCELGK